MRKLFVMLDQLTDLKVPFCLQSQGNFYNISIQDPMKRQHGWSAKDIDEIESYVDLMWEEELENRSKLASSVKTVATKSKTAIPIPIPRPF